MSAWACRIPASATAPLASSPEAFVASASLTSLIAICNRFIPVSPVRSAPESWTRGSSHRQAGANTCPGAAAIPRSWVCDGLLVEVTAYQVAQGRNRGVRLWTIRSNRDCHALADPQRQHAEDALGVPHHAILDHFDPGVFESGSGLYEERRGPSMQADLVCDGQRQFCNGLLPSSVP